VDDMLYTMQASCRMQVQREFCEVQLLQQPRLLKQKSLPGLFFVISSITT
jgi:hypothetical protein